MAVYVGLDIGGTKFMARACDADGTFEETVRHETPQNLNEGIDLLHRMVADTAKGREIAGIGAAIGGPLDWKRGIVSPLHQPAWRDVPLGNIMEKRWGCPFHVDVDTNVAALGEYDACPEKPARLLYITLSTGMGGGFLVDGRVYRGLDEGHPEIGHQAINFRCSNPSAISCECGVPDCLEALVSGNGIRRIYGRPAEELDERQWEEVTYNLAQGIRNVAAIYLPDLVVLGGGIAHGRGERLAADLHRLVSGMLRIVPMPRIRISRLGYETALLGATVLARLGHGS